MNRPESKHVLVVDDSADNRDLIRQICAWLGYRMTEAVDGLEGVRFARSGAPDLILMDLGMPVCDGWEATATLKADPGTRRIPVVAVTAHVMDHEYTRALAAGCDEYVTKPIDLVPFCDMLRRYLGAGRPRG